ncbi:MAG TPA: YfhO family protein [Blastocatellia bacterium]|nr:YfhO family protein [Blastocatellia bacterium]
MNQSLKTRIARPAAAVVLLVLPLLYFWPAVLGRVTLAPGDGSVQIFGIRLLVGQMIRDGQWPLWNPYLFAGMPFLASIQPGALYPPTWLFAWLSPPVAMNITVITTYHLALIGTYLYARRIGLNRLGAMVAGLTFTFGGYLVAHLGHPGRIAAAAWLPWILLAIEELYLQARWRWVALGAIFISLQLFAGEPQMNCYTVLVAGAYGVFSLTLRELRERRSRFLMGLVAMAGCGVLISMAQLLPTLELIKLTERAGLRYEYFAQCSLPHKQLYGLIFPYFLGGGVMEPYRLPYWGMCSLTEYCDYVGILALLLATAMTVKHLAEKSRDRVVWFWIVCALLAFFLALGVYMPFGIHRLLHRVPIYNLFRGSARHLLEFTFAIGILAGFGVARLPELARTEWAKTRRMVWLSVTILGLLAVAGIVTLKFFSPTLLKLRPSHAQTNPFTLPEVYIPIVFFALSVTTLLLYLRRQGWLTGSMLMTVLFLDLMSFGFFYEWRAFGSGLDAHLADPPTVKLIKEREGDLNGLRIVTRSSDPWGRNSDLLDSPNLSIVRGLQSVNGYDPLRLVRLVEVAGGMSVEGYVKQEEAFNSDHQGFNLLNVRYLLYERTNVEGPLKLVYDVETGSPGPAVNATLPADRWRMLAQFGEVELYENLKALPRAWFVRDAVTVSSAEQLRIIKSGKLPDGTPFDPSRTVLFEEEERARLSNLLPEIGDPAWAEVKIAEYEPSRIKVLTRNSLPGFLVLSEIYYPGWEVRIDGQPAPVERVDYVLRGVAVPRGEHRLEFVFRHQPFRTGAILTLAGLALLIVGAIFNHRKTDG